VAALIFAFFSHTFANFIFISV